VLRQNKKCLTFEQFVKLISFDFGEALIGDYNELKAPEELTDPRRWNSN
jgi:hypothetical protein